MAHARLRLLHIPAQRAALCLPLTLRLQIVCVIFSGYVLCQHHDLDLYVIFILR